MREKPAAKGGAEKMHRRTPEVAANGVNPEVATNVVKPPEAPQARR